ncbi:rRNA methyltransferase [bacterium]|jgi:23S rRNA (adenine2503-C2)-methyltransferase|nr:rRNA methyltransferase [bacterium]
MINKVKIFPSSEGNVWKYIFEFNDAIAEAVLYKYNKFSDRTVICCSVQSGCPVGCKFCGTGNKFIRNLTSDEIVDQIKEVVSNVLLNSTDMLRMVDCNKFQIMFMSMGEPMLNFDNVNDAITKLHLIYPNAQLLISTVGINNQKTLSHLVKLSQDINKVGLQFSIHQAYDEKRNELIPFKNKLSLREIRDYGIHWNKVTKRPVYLNYCIDGTNISDGEINRLKDLFDTNTFHFTFSVICSSDETMKDAGYRNHDVINDVMNSFIEDGYNVRVFDPAGQDDIGGGCGQLFHVQRWFNNFNN